jgi:D-alanyl-D-alanine carboxypeptidase
LTKSIRGAVREASIPGTIVGVWQARRKPYVRAYGVRNKASGRRMSPKLHMRIGSETKTFTVTALLQLVGKGMVGLDDPIGKYVPGIVNGDTITLRQLASMTSGLPSYTETESFFDDLVSDPRRSFTPQQLLAYVAAAPAHYAPGMGFNYSNTNTILLGLVVEKVSGQSLPRYIERHIIKPLHMSHTTFATDARFPSPHAQGYTEQTADGKIANATRWNPSWGWAAGSIISTLHDLRIWARHLATGKGLLPRAQRRERMQSVKEKPGAASAYGIGMFSVAGWVGHNGSLPGY